MAKWWYLRNRIKMGEKRPRYHNCRDCLFAAVLIGVRDELYYLGMNKGKWSNYRKGPVPCCWACGLPIDCSLAQVKRFYDKLEKEIAL